MNETPRVSLKSFLLPLIPYFFIAVGLMAPFASNEIAPAHNDMRNHMNFMIQARQAIDEGQFPIRVAPFEHDGWGYPVFQFYSTLPYWVGAQIYAHVFPSDPYLALKSLFVLSLMLAAWFVYLLGRLYAGAAVSFLAGALYITAPYILFNVVIRSHITEIVAQALVPALFLAGLAFLRSPSVLRFVSASLVYFAIGATHPITFVYAPLFLMAFAPFILWDAIRTGNLSFSVAVKRYALLALALAGGAALAAYIYLPVFVYRYSLYVTAFPKPFGLFFMPLMSLLAPCPILIPNLMANNPSPYFATGIGLPSLLVAGFALWRLRRPHAVGSHSIALMAAVGFFLLSCFLAWSPVDFWQYIPRPFWVIQFAFRFLTYASLFAVLIFCLLARLKEGTEEGRAVMVAAGVGFLILTAIPWIQTTEAQTPLVQEEHIANPLLRSAYDAYLFCPHPFITTPASFAEGQIDINRWEKLLQAKDAYAVALQPLLKETTLTAFNRLLEERDLAKRLDAQFLVLPPNIEPLLTPQGAARADLTTDDLRKLNRAVLQSRFPEVTAPTYLPMLEKDAPVASNDIARTVHDTKPLFKRVKGRIEGTIQMEKAGWVQIPAIHYPLLSQILVNNRPVAARSSLYRGAYTHDSVQRYFLVTLWLEPGSHTIQISFTGYRPANIFSAVAWVLALILLLTGFFLSRPFLRFLSRSNVS